MLGPRLVCGLALGALSTVCACGAASQRQAVDIHPRPTPLDATVQSPSLLWRKEPASKQGARQTVLRLFDVVAREAGPELEPLFTEDALYHRPNQPTGPAVIGWTRRLAAGDYTRQVITGDVPLQLVDHETALALGGHRTLHLEPQTGEMLVLVTLPSFQPSPASLWGSELQAVLVPAEGRWRIRAVWEDFNPK